MSVAVLQEARRAPVRETPTHYDFVPLTPGELSAWDILIRPYDSRELFHSQAWLDYLAASRGVEIQRWAIHEDGRPIGYFCGGLLQKGPFRIFGSPLKGWGTNFLGPVINRDVDQRAFFRALDELARRERWAMLELENPILSEACFEAHGFSSYPQPTFLVELTPEDPQIMWGRIQQRSEVRKARRNGLIVEDTNDPAIADEYYDQYIEILRPKHTFPSYDRTCPRLLFEHLRPYGRLLALQVREPGGLIVATGLFPYDDRTLYFWGGAGRLSGRKHAPNDLLHWTAMEMGAARGLRLYNMCGNGFFKSKFGGTYDAPKRWQKYYWASARWARRGYEGYFKKRMSVQGWWHWMMDERTGAR